MGERQIAGQMLALLHEQCAESDRVAQAVLQWVKEHRSHFWPAEHRNTAQTVRGGQKEKKQAKKRRKSDEVRWSRLPELAGRIAIDAREPLCLTAAEAVADMLAFDDFDRGLLRTVILTNRLHRLAALRRRLVQADADLLLLFGLMAGAANDVAVQRVRRSLPLTLGLIEIHLSHTGQADFDTHWSFDRFLDRGAVDEERLIEAMIGSRQTASLAVEDFEDQSEAVALLLPLFRQAVRDGTPGINVLIHGPPGTGKTEFARMLAAAAGLRLFAVGEVDEDGEEPTRDDRLHALKRAHRLLTRRRDSILLFDEMEDLFAPATAGIRNRIGSKIFVNRLLEANAVPTIWTSNSIDEIDPAHLRRLSFVLRMDHPSSRSRRRIVERIAASEGFADVPEAVRQLTRHHPETASIARAAFRTARLTGRCPAHASAAAHALVVAMRGGHPLPPMRGRAEDLDLALYESDPPLQPLVETLAGGSAPCDFSLLLSGPPGTGKTALAAHLAEAVGRPLLVRRSSDLLSKWVGGTEANIARAFARAREDGAVLLFDEVDGLLADRSAARQSWEVTQVNEMLTWMDEHDLPLIATTNHADRLDPAAVRRFLFKVSLQELSERRARQAFERFFTMPAPEALRKVQGLTPADFALVARQLRFRPAVAADDIVRKLAMEVKARPGRPARIGF